MSEQLSQKGICLSDKFLAQLNTIKKFNYDKIYNNERFNAFKKYSELVLSQIFETLYKLYDGKHSFESLDTAKDITLYLYLLLKNGLQNIVLLILYPLEN